MSGYLEWKKSYVTEGTFESYQRWYLRFLKFLKKEPLQLTLEDIGRFKIYLKNKGYVPKNIEYGLTIVKDYINYLMTVEGLLFPFSLFKIQRERAKSHYAITQKEYLKMIVQVSNPDIQSIQRRVMLQIMWETGIRVGELLNLKVSQLTPGKAIIENEKNKRQRMIAWSANTEKLLQRYVRVRKRVSCDTDHLFVALGYKRIKAKKMTARNVQLFVVKIIKDAKLTNKISPHSFRHGFVHRQLAVGKPLTTVAQMLGHSTSLNILTYHQLSGLEVKEAWKTAA